MRRPRGRAFRGGLAFAASLPCMLNRARVLLAVLLTSLVAGILLLPVLVSPIAGDDRWLYPMMGSYPTWTPLDELRLVLEWMDRRLSNGRVNVITLLERRIAARAVMETAVGLDTSLARALGILKALLVVVVVVVMAAFVRTLRWRDDLGALVRASRSSVVLATLGGGLLFALGGQAQMVSYSGRNGWVGYPTSTYGAVVSILGVAALVLWLTRLVAMGRHRLVALGSLVLLGILTNFRYELVFPAVPLAIITLLLFPVTDRESAEQGRRAKWQAAAAYAGSFALVFVPVRLLLRAQCASGACYDAVEPSLGVTVLRTFWVNVASSVPGTGHGPLREFVAAYGVSTDGLFTPTVFSVLVGLAVGAAFAAVWWAAAPPRVRPEASGAVATARAEVRLLLAGALVCLLGALGAAGVMSLSAGAQQSVTEVGHLYRHTVVTWAGLAWALVLVVTAGVAAGRRGGRMRLVGPWLALSVAAGLLAVVLVPANQRALQADRVRMDATEDAFAALVDGDLSREANTRRCVVKQRVRASTGGDAPPILWFLRRAFERYWDQPFCIPAGQPQPEP